MIKGTVARNDMYWLGHPDIALFNNRLYVCFRQSSQHLAPSDTQICITTSDSKNISKWSLPKVVASGYRFNCPRLSVHQGVLYLICDVIPGGENFIASENGPDTRIWIWSTTNGDDWSEPIKTNIQGIVPDRLFVARNGDLIIGTHTKKYTYGKHKNAIPVDEASIGSQYAKEDITGKLVQNVWRSRSISEKWDGPFKVADFVSYNFCEGSVFDSNENFIGCMMRENSRRGEPSYYMLSQDFGASWMGPYKTRMFGCHRPVIGRLKSSRLLTTYREQTHSINKPYWARNTFACLSEPDDWKVANNFVHSIILPLDHDSSPKPDSGYTGWVQMDDDRICVVNYITDDALRPYIRYYVIKESDF